MSDLRHAGIGWPENSGGEHPTVEYILSVPGIQQGCCLICSPSARYHYAYLRSVCPTVVWRAIPRQGKLPADLGWDPDKVADECLNLWDEQPHGGTEFFQPLNELQFEKEAGEPFPGYTATAEYLAGVRRSLQQKIPGVQLVFPPWVPSDELQHLDAWRAEAEQWNVIGLHCYESAEQMRQRYLEYRAAFPNHVIHVGEWNANHHGHSEYDSLVMWAEIARDDPLFLGACYFIWETNNPGEQDLSIWTNDARETLFLHPPVLPLEEPLVTEIEQFIREAAAARGIDPDIAVKVAKSEGGVTEPAAHGDFATGDSWWPFQLHYGGVEYPQFGTVAGMGSGFTKLTGWQPGDPAAWKDSVRYALNRAKASGWNAWYGAAHVGIGPWDGIDRNAPWDAASERWDFEEHAPTPPVPAKVVYNALEPAHPQDKSYDCSQESLEWAFWAVGRHPSDAWMTQAMIDQDVMSPEQGLLDATGKGLADFITRNWEEFGFYANNSDPVTFGMVANEAGPYPLLIGGRAWNHWTGVRGYDKERDVLLLANPAEGYKGIGQTLSGGQFGQLGPFSMVRVLHPDLVAPAPPPVVKPPPECHPDEPPLEPPVVTDEVAALHAEVKHLRTILGYASVDISAALQKEVDGIKEKIGALEAAISTLRAQKDA